MKYYLVSKCPKFRQGDEPPRTYFTIRASNMEEAVLDLNVLINNEKGADTLEPIGWFSEDTLADA